MRAGLVRTAVMSSDLIAYLIAALAIIVCVTVAFGLPALAIVLVKYFKLKERELALEVEYRQKSQQDGNAIQQRVQRLDRLMIRIDEREISVGLFLDPHEARVGQ